MPNRDLATAPACANLEANTQCLRKRQGCVDFVPPVVDGARAHGIADAWDFATAEERWPPHSGAVKAEAPEAPARPWPLGAL